MNGILPPGPPPPAVVSNPVTAAFSHRSRLLSMLLQSEKRHIESAIVSPPFFSTERTTFAGSKFLAYPR